MSTTGFSIFSRRAVFDAGVGPATVIIKNERIASVTPGHAGPRETRHLDLGDLALMPGVIDAHVHVNEPGRTDWEGFRTAGRAAAAGGVTTIVVMPLNCSPVATTVAALKAEADAALASCAVDFGFWGGLVPGNTAELPALWNAGVLGFKCFLVHSGIDDFPNATERDLELGMPILSKLTPSGAALLAHAEDPAEIAAARAPSGLDQNPKSYAAYLASRPPAAEERAIDLMIRLCRKHRSRTHIVHVAASSALPALAAARREGLPISTETCPHYLSFAAEEIKDGPGGTIFKCAPPIRDRANRDRLWAALKDGTLDLVASDHSPCPPKLKLLDTGDFAKAWGGISSLQLTLPVVWTHASARGFSLTDLTRWLSAAPARLAGIDAFKGQIAPGFDADLTVFDPDVAWTVRAADLQHRHKITPYDRSRLRGEVRATFVRGRQVFAAPGFERISPLGDDGFPMQGADGDSVEASGRWVKKTRSQTSSPT